jgi:hypothetical protein
VIGATAVDKDIVIKVVDDNEDFQREVDALKVLVPHYYSVRKDIDTHYALGYYSMIVQQPSSSSPAVSAGESKVSGNTFGFENMSIVADTQDNKNENKSVTDSVHADENNDNIDKSNGIIYVKEILNSEYWKLQVQRCTEFMQIIKDATNFINFSESSTCDVVSNGGSILMRPGISISVANDNIPSVFLGACKSLQLTHACGFCHRDVRLSNILKFGVSYQLIDFGLSGPVNGDVVLQAGGRLDGVGYRLQGRKSADIVNWMCTDDYEMLIQTITALFAIHHR